MGGVEQACEYLHLPVQAGSNRILELMNRGYDRDFYMERAARARELVSGLTLSTDIIVGFPGETERDFDDTLDLVRSVAFDAAYMFVYSPRDGTDACQLRDDVPPGEKRMRFAELARIQDEVTRNSLSKIVGESVEILVEAQAKNKGQVTGRSRSHRVVVLPADEAPIDSLVSAKIIDSGGHALRGRVDSVLYRPSEKRQG
jgi:tRNA-2-methylthio-N6-dimethylallyladenosine synthase